MHINTWNTTYRLGWGKMLLRDVADEAVRLQMENLDEKKIPQKGIHQLSYSQHNLIPLEINSLANNFSNELFTWTVDSCIAIPQKHFHLNCITCNFPHISLFLACTPLCSLSLLNATTTTTYGITFLPTKTSLIKFKK